MVSLFPSLKEPGRIARVCHDALRDARASYGSRVIGSRTGRRNHRFPLYGPTIDAILLCSALPVFADSDLKTFQVDPNDNDIEHCITEHARAILPVHILGVAANLDEILAIVAKHNLLVIEDACQRHMAEWRGKKRGTLGKVGCCSFQESKNLPGGGHRER